MNNTEEIAVKELEKIAKKVHLPLEKHLLNTAVWFHKNKGRIPDENLKERVAFLEKSLDIFLDLAALTMQRIQRVEQRPKSSPIFIPGID